MLRIIGSILGYFFLGIVVTAVLLLFFALVLSIPELLDIMSVYIGDVFTWVIFIFIIVGIVSIGINRGK